MIAFCLDRLGLDPAFLIGGEIPQLGGNARAGSGLLVVEGDESDRSVAALRPEIAVLLNVDLDHHATFGTRAEVGSSSRAGSRRCRTSCGPRSSSRSTLELACPGRAQPAERRRSHRRARARRSAARGRRACRSSSSTARRGGSSGRARRAASRVLDSYAHHPAELAADIARAARDGGRVLALFQPHLYSRTRAPRARVRRGARGCRRGLRHGDLSGARGAAPGRDRAADRRRARAASGPGCASAGRRRVEDAARMVASWARAGDTVLTLGAGDVDRAAPLLLELLA